MSSTKGVTISYNVFFFQAEDGIRDGTVTGVQTCALPIWIFQLLPRVHRAHVDHPDIAIAVDVDLVREDEQARAEALQDISIGIELVHRRPARARAAVVLEGRFARRDVGVRAAAVHYPDRAAVVVDRDAVERAPFAVIGRQVAPW